MKTLYIYVCIFACMTAALTSCSDFLDTTPSTEIATSEAITSVASAQSAINGCYDIMQNSYYYNQFYLIYGDIRGDDVQSDAGNQISYSLYVYDHFRLNSASSSIGYMWFRPLQLIRNTSSIIEAIDAGKITDGTDEAKNNIKGHALALRAMAHFDLVKVFGYPFAKDNGQSWGVPIIDKALDIDDIPVRSTVDETYRFIVAELEKAIPLMSTAKTDYNQMNAYGARALLARTCLYWEKNDKAFEVASTLIEELKNGSLYQLYTTDNYLAAFAYNSEGTNFDRESLLEIFNTSMDNPARNGLAYMYSPNGYAENMLTAKFKSFIQSDPEDVRNGIVGYYGNGAPYLAKYPGEKGQAAFDNNYPLIRLSEVYLIAAEAAIKSEDATKRNAGLEYLNVIVKRGNPANNVTDEEYTLERVLDERRKEFVGEGHRYFDLLRNGISFSRSGGYHYNAATGYDIDWNFYRCILPIPLDQFKLNPNLQQNEGYEKE
ncbi:MAG: RagB/SusD family nutrient uptake outer membrane protein [Tannerella sp.]|nr:RagB/SusD family nutrient uptake outer membrane protein [Tannerella sp.]